MSKHVKESLPLRCEPTRFAVDNSRVLESGESRLLMRKLTDYPLARRSKYSMATYAVFCTPGYGHVNPTLALAQELVACGERVIYYLPEDFRPAVEATGAVFRLYESG